MAGTIRDRTPPADLPAAPAPVVILVRPQLGENIGTTARAMLNCAISELRLVSPRDGWPSERAYSASSRADKVLDGVKLYESVADAIADLNYVYATAARPRDLIKPVATPRHAAGEIRQRMAAGDRVGILFGPERTGLENDDLVLADQIITVPLNPTYDSLNLAQAVLLVGYEWYLAADDTPEKQIDYGDTRVATKGEHTGFLQHLEAELEASGFFANIPEKQAGIMLNIKTMFERAEMTEQEVRTMRGVVRALALGRPNRRRGDRKRGQIGEPGGESA